MRTHLQCICLRNITPNIFSFFRSLLAHHTSYNNPGTFLYSKKTLTEVFSSSSFLNSIKKDNFFRNLFLDYFFLSFSRGFEPSFYLLIIYEKSNKKSGKIRNQKRKRLLDERCRDMEQRPRVCSSILGFFVLSCRSAMLH